MQFRAGFLLTLALGACQNTEETGPRPVDAPSVASAPAQTAPTPTCSPDEVRCVSTHLVARCTTSADRWVQEPCAEATACAEGRCVALDRPGLERSELRAVATTGWLNGWSVVRPLADVDAERLAKATPIDFAKSNKATAVCAPDGFVAPLVGVKGRDGALARGVLLSGTARQARLLLGVAGEVDVYLNGKALGHFEETPGRESQAAFADEHAIEIKLNEGPNDLALVVRRVHGMRGEPGFWLRIRADDEQPIEGQAFVEALSSARCSPASLLSTSAALSVIDGGLLVTSAPEWKGLIAESDVSFRVSLNGQPVPTSDIDLAIDHHTKNAHYRAAVTGLKQGRNKLAIEVAPTGRDAFETASAHQPFYSETLHPRMAAVKHQFALGIQKKAPQASQDSFEHMLGRLEQTLVEDGERFGEWIESELDRADGLISAFQAGRDPYPEQTGVFWRAYRSPLDGQLQPYLVYVPPSYKGRESPIPMILIEHGLDRLPEHALRTLIGEAPTPEMGLSWSAKNLPAFPDLGAILVAPWGYENAGPRILGETDLVTVIKEMQRAYRIDDSRISLTGYSLGGTVAFVAPLHFPDLFSMSAPLCGYPNLTTYQSIQSVPHTPWEEVLIAKRYIVNYADNGLHLPLHIVHGGLDQPGRSKVVSDRYAELGYRHTFDLQSDLDHNVWDYAYAGGQMVAMLRDRQRPTAPAHVILRSGEYRYNRAYWLELVGMQDSASTGLSQIDAQFDVNKRALVVRTENVSAFAIHPDQMPKAARDGSLNIRIDETTLQTAAGPDPIYFQLADRQWARVDQAPTSLGRKNHLTGGPMDDALAHPTLIVYGTIAPAHTETNRLVAKHFSSYDTYSGANFPVLADTEVTERQARSHTLVLIGGPASNRWTQKLQSGIPAEITSTGVTFRGKTFPGAEVGVSLIVPNPKNPEQYVVLHAGVSPSATRRSRYLPRLVPDYLIYDERLAVQRGGMLLDEREVLDGGFFNEEWK